MGALARPQVSGVKFRRQHQIGRYITDFCCPEHRLVVELDGGHHAHQTQSDQRRTDFLVQLGYQVLRFWDHEVLVDPDAVVQSIANVLKLPSPHPSPSKGEGEKPSNSGRTIKKVITRQHGFTMIEVMIALVILAVGLLGVAAMQGIAVSRNVDAKQLSTVTNLADEMLERIRFNAANLTQYNGVQTCPTWTSDTVCSTAAPNYGLTNPPIAEPALGDVRQWKNRLEATVPGSTTLRSLTRVNGRILVCPPASCTNQTQLTAMGGNEVQITITWIGIRKGETVVAGGLIHRVVLTSIVRPGSSI